MLSQNWIGSIRDRVLNSLKLSQIAPYIGHEL